MKNTGIKEKVKKGEMTATAAVEVFKSIGARDCKAFSWLLSKAATEKAQKTYPKK